MSRRRIEVHIEELILDGFAPADRHHVADAVSRELEQLFAESHASFAHDTELSHVDGGSFNMRPGDGAKVVGAGIARSVHGGLNR